MTISTAPHKTDFLVLNNNITFIFDFDYTLVKTDGKKDRKSLFLKINLEKYVEKTLKIFNLIKTTQYDSLFVVTARHNITIPKIAKILQIDEKKIITRNYCLSKEEMKVALSTPEKEDAFVKKSIDYKVDTYNIFAKDSRIVIVFDDHAGFINKKSRLAPNVIVLEPIY